MAPREPALTLGIEEEYLLVDLETRALVTRQDPGFMRACQAELGEQVSHELLQSQVEIGTGVCRTIGRGPRRPEEPARDGRRDRARVRHGPRRRLDPPLGRLAATSRTSTWTATAS